NLRGIDDRVAMFVIEKDVQLPILLLEQKKPRAMLRCQILVVVTGCPSAEVMACSGAVAAAGAGFSGSDTAPQRVIVLTSAAFTRRLPRLPKLTINSPSASPASSSSVSGYESSWPPYDPPTARTKPRPCSGCETLRRLRSAGLQNISIWQSIKTSTSFSYS